MKGDEAMRKIIRWVITVVLVFGAGYLVLNPPKADCSIVLGHYTNRWRGLLPDNAQWIANQMAEAAVRDGCYNRNRK